MHQMILVFLPEVLLHLHLGYLASVTDKTSAVFYNTNQEMLWTQALLPLHFRAVVKCLKKIRLLNRKQVLT